MLVCIILCSLYFGWFTWFGLGVCGLLVLVWIGCLVTAVGWFVWLVVASCCGCESVSCMFNALFVLWCLVLVSAEV